MSTCDFTTPCSLRDWTHQRTRWSHQTRDRASPWRFACMACDRIVKSRFSGGSAPPTRTLTNQHCDVLILSPFQLPNHSIGRWEWASSNNTVAIPRILQFSQAQVNRGIHKTIEHHKHLSLLFGSTKEVITMLDSTKHAIASR